MFAKQGGFWYGDDVIIGDNWLVNEHGKAIVDF